MPTVRLPDGKTLDVAPDATVADVAAAIGPRLARAAVAGKVSGQLVDLRAPVRDGDTVAIVTLNSDDPDALYVLRHSAAHVMAQAICELFPSTQLVYGPPVDDGFYYDIDLDRPLTPEDFPAIEARMAEIVQADHPFTRLEMDRQQGLEKVRAQGSRYKIDNAQRADGDLSFYVTGTETGRDFEDLCRGPHLPSTGKIGAFKLMQVSGAYYRGDPNDKQLQRVYGTAWPTRKDLAAYLDRLEQARKRDHRRIGQELNLFVIDAQVGGGLVLWKPRGAILRRQLEEMMSQELQRAGYEMVYTPHIGRLSLYRTSGHFPYYKDAQFPPMFESDRAALLNALWEAAAARGEGPEITAQERAVLEKIQRTCPALHQELNPGSGRRYAEHGPAEPNVKLVNALLEQADGYLLRPMNCPHHIRIYTSEPHSYRDLPVRLAEFGTVYRQEQSGELSGLTRVRGFTQDDAHIFCRPEQLLDEIAGCVNLTRNVLEILELRDYEVRVSLREPGSDKYVGSEENWNLAEQAVRSAVAASGMHSTVAVGEAAFYGPKIDFIVRDCIGRQWQLGTVQVDYNLPERFDLSYIGSDNAPHRPIMIHRAPFGSLERFVGILIEHFAGAFPLWLAPVQVVVASISQKSADYARQVSDRLAAAGLRVELDVSAEKIGPKKHAARRQRIPYILVVGEQEASRQSVNVNDRSGKMLATEPVDAFIARCRHEIETRSAGSAVV